ncbi:MAG: DEAD/DEAH box helicase family protein, partial [Prevotellaceae bacterium]|nr:DEAD/DEAH box helicase family protein [Prevotellaceae bacterium]
ILPFNKGVGGGAGNPVNPNGLRPAYLWEDILSKDSLSDILENYAQTVGEGRERRTIWPRYHQLDAVRRLVRATLEGGVGQRFLIQHSAGSGKSNTLTWLAYRLVGLMKGTSPVVDTVVVVTDRVNLDSQISRNISSFRRLSNLVEHADRSRTLREALEDGKKIVVTTVQKFPYILDAIGSELRDKRFGIIIDEAHSSQNGSLSAQMNMALSGNTGEEEDDVEECLNRIIEGRKMVRNANYYAFTATPKNKTLEMFGTPEPQPDGKTRFRPFHEYTMKQAIEEHFIMDVLRNYTTYQSFYHVIKTIVSDPEFDQKEAAGRIRAYVEGRPETVGQKADVIVDHFLGRTRDKIGGEARAMVVTSSIKRAIDLFKAITERLEKRHSPYRAIVAFSGSKEVEGKQMTEADINGFPSSEIEQRIATDPYRLLVVANKYQTGYDQPLLHTMYVDKELSDVAAVQTLSRLNRCHPKKRDTFVLDFCNSADTIQSAFQRFYKTTILSDKADPNKLNDLMSTVESFSIYTTEELDELCRLYIKGEPRERLDPLLDRAVERFKQLDDKGKIACKSAVKGFVRTYPFIAAVTSLESREWEKTYIYYSLLAHKLPRLDSVDLAEGLEECIDLDQLRVTRTGQKSISLADEDAEIGPLPISAEPRGVYRPDMARLSSILDQFNEIHWKNRELVARQIDSLPERLREDRTFVNATLNSNEETALREGFSSMMSIVMGMMEENTELFREYMNNPDFKHALNNIVVHNVYNSLRGGQRN